MTFGKPKSEAAADAPKAPSSEPAADAAKAPTSDSSTPSDSSKSSDSDKASSDAAEPKDVAANIQGTILDPNHSSRKAGA